MEMCDQLCRLGADATSSRVLEAPRLLFILAHPDDEVLAVGGRMEWLTQSRFVTVTDGVPLDGADARAHGFASLSDYGAARRAELHSAMHLAGLDPACAAALRLSSGEEVSDQRAAFSLVEIALALEREITAFRPEALLTQPYEGGHPDHDACAFAVWAAARRVGFAGPVLEAAFYHAGSEGIETGVFLPGSDAGCEARLTKEQAEKKRLRLACFSSQAETLRLFAVLAERFRLAPRYDFAQRPMEGELYYERFPWGLNGHRFCELTWDARRELGI